MSRMTGLQHTDDARESRRKLTYADFVRFPDDGRRHELIDGEHYVTASPNLRHQFVLQRLNVALANHLKASRAGHVFFKVDCVFSFFDVVEPDLVVVLKDRNEILTKRNIKGAPSIVVEVLSPSTSKRDRIIKRDLYERQGVKEYWILDSVRNTITIHRLATKRFKQPEILRLQNDDTLRTDLLPGFALTLEELFAED
jgi:Uma2 family endonuclease